MTKKEILEQLCYHDKRNPIYDSEMDHLDKGEAIGGGEACFYDNCFYGRTKLANELLLLMDKYEPKSIH